MLKGPGRSGTEQNHIEAEFAMKGTRPPQAGLSFHGFFKIVGPAGEFRSVSQASGLMEQTSGPVPQLLGFWSRLPGLRRRLSDFWSRFLLPHLRIGHRTDLGELVPKIPWEFRGNCAF